MSRLISDQIDRKLSDDIELLGLIHAMGMLILASNFPNDCQALPEQAQNGGHPMDVLERQQFSNQHGSIMNSPLEQFHLPIEFTKLLSVFHTHTEIDNIETAP